MTNNKICNVSTSTQSAQTCYICKATPKEINNIEKKIPKDVDSTMFRSGLSTLNAQTQFFKCLLHVSYRFPSKTQLVRNKNKNVIQARKKIKKKRFWYKMEVLVDLVKPGKSSTTNDGNTERNFLSDPEKSANITYT